jgi:hypothetical protein
MLHDSNFSANEIDKVFQLLDVCVVTDFDGPSSTLHKLRDHSLGNVELALSVGARAMRPKAAGPP